MSDKMTTSERIKAVLNFKPVDRLPITEWAPYWDPTVKRWESEGLPEGMNNLEIQRYFGLDAVIIFAIPPYVSDMPEPAHHGASRISSKAEYDALLEQNILFSASRFGDEMLKQWDKVIRQRNENGDISLILAVNGFFWFPRTLFGINLHLYAFYDQPELMHRMNRDLAEFNLRALEAFCKVGKPDFLLFHEDMSYNHGAMLSRKQFDEFMRPYYEIVIPRLKKLNIKVIVDSDGDITECAEWFRQAGVEGMLPLERQAGVDIAELRDKYPSMVWIGAYDKMVMNRGEAAIRTEFERIMPVAKQGGLVIGCDHQTPPSVSLEQYRDYIRCFREYATQ